MFDLHCPQCDRTYLMDIAEMTSLRNTDHGLIATARCPLGHDVEHHFHAQLATTH